MTSRDENRRLAEAYAKAMGIGVGDTQLHNSLADGPDKFTHDYAACQEVSCFRCAAYAIDTRQAGNGLALRYATGIRSSTRPPANVIRAWPIEIP